MALETIPIQSIWRLFKWLPGFLLRQYFTQEKLAQLIYLDLRPRHNSATVDLGESASFSLYLLAINLSPFSVELDRAGFRFWIGGAPLDAVILKKQLISPGEIACLYISGTIPDGLANQIAKNLDNAAGLGGNIEFNCSVRPFSKTVGLLDGISPKIYNAHLRRNT